MIIVLLNLMIIVLLNLMIIHTRRITYIIIKFCSFLTLNSALSLIHPVLEIKAVLAGWISALDSGSFV